MNYTNAADNDQGQFQGGNPNVGLKGTVVDAPWLNAVQTEIATVVESNGIALKKNDDGQLKKAIDKYIFDTKFGRVLFQEIASKVIDNSHSHVFQTISCPKKSFIDCDVYFNALCNSSSGGNLMIRVYADEHGAGGVYCSVGFPWPGRKWEMHRLVFVNNSDADQKFSISVGTTTPGASFLVDLTISGCIDFSNCYKG